VLRVAEPSPRPVQPHREPLRRARRRGRPLEPMI
jgi:hypothetical protein